MEHTLRNKSNKAFKFNIVAIKQIIISTSRLYKA
jgi:hypothetical protein